MGGGLRGPREIAQAISWSRRDFLRAATGASAGASLFGLGALPAMASPRGRKAIVVTFGGGARDEETFMPEGQENIPHLLSALIPRATIFTQVVNRGILGHYVATASLATGVYDAEGIRVQWRGAGGASDHARPDASGRSGAQ